MQSKLDVGRTQLPPRSSGGELSAEKIAQRIDLSANVKEQMKDMLEVINLLKDEHDSRNAQIRNKIEGMQQHVQ